ncbi:MAG: 4a-hydroxytetrahydrobiopterin dehydratase [Bryobacterales bacterium]|nr:4a-hydroxytetrahydrobiopterin dehydratase [Bryobacterales bacterium]
MSDVEKFSDAEIASALSTLDGWSVEGGKLHKEYKFPDFVQAFAFMTAAALEIERLQHHPEWCNTYNTVRVDLTTHDCGGISQRDFELARLLDQRATK